MLSLNHLVSVTMCIFAPLSASHVSVVQKVPVKKVPKTRFEKHNVLILDSLVLAPPDCRLHNTALGFCGKESAEFACVMEKGAVPRESARTKTSLSWARSVSTMPAMPAFSFMSLLSTWTGNLPLRARGIFSGLLTQQVSSVWPVLLQSS